MTTAEKWERFSDGMEVYTKTWLTNSPPIAHIFFLHGFSDHCNAYETFNQTVSTQHSIEVYSFDQRGWGLTSQRANTTSSPPTTRHNGLSGGTSKIFHDITSLLGPRLSAHPNIPCFLVGHSMGGGVALTYALRGELRNRLAGTVVWSPMIDVAKEGHVSALKLAALKVGSLILPDKQSVQHLPPEYMSRDPAVVERFKDDPLCHDTGTLEGLAAMFDRAAELRSGRAIARFDGARPILVLHGSGDKVTNHDASRKFVAALHQVEDKEFRSFEGWFHKMHAEPGDDKFVFARYVAEWIAHRSKSGGGAGGASKL